jgi:hypothetical protein
LLRRPFCFLRIDAGQNKTHPPMTGASRFRRNQVKLGCSGFVLLLCLVGIDPVIDVLANIIDFLANSGTRVIRSELRLGLVTIRRNSGCILYVAPRLFGGALYLVGYALIGQLLVAYGFTNALFDASRYLLHLAGHLILIHDLSPCACKFPSM